MEKVKQENPFMGVKNKNYSNQEAGPDKVILGGKMLLRGGKEEGIKRKGSPR